jgi:hypothetical protein
MQKARHAWPHVEQGGQRPRMQGEYKNTKGEQQALQRLEQAPQPSPLMVCICKNLAAILQHQT